MATQELIGTTALVTGASRGFGRAVAVALHEAGANVVAIARNGERLGELRDQLGGSLATVAADAADPVVAGSLLDQYRLKTLVLNAGACAVAASSPARTTLKAAICSRIAFRQPGDRAERFQEIAPPTGGSS